VAAAFAVLYLAFIVAKLRRQQLSVRGSLLWLLSGVLMLVLSLWPAPLYAAARAAGFVVPANAVFVLWLLVLTMLLFSQSLALSRAQEQLRRLAQDQAIEQAERGRREPHVGRGAGASPPS
jgi:hypothetical protein